MPDQAVVIGVSHYPGHSALEGTTRDAEEFHRWLTSPSGGALAPADCQLLLSRNYEPHPGDPFETRPFHEDVHARFRSILLASRGGARLGDRLFIFFAGHGVASSERIDSAGFLSANSTKASTMARDVYAYVDWFRRRASFGSVIFIYDCCRGIQPTIAPVDPDLEKFIPSGSPSRAFCAYASDYGALARERDFGGGQVHGYLTRALLDALKGAKPNASGELTGSAVKNFIHARVADFRTRWNDVPDPVIEADTNAEVIFARGKAVPTHTVTVAIPSEQVGTTIRLEDGTLQAIAGTPRQANAALLRFQVQPGFYRFVLDGVPHSIFDVTGDCDVRL